MANETSKDSVEQLLELLKQGVAMRFPSPSALSKEEGTLKVELESRLTDFLKGYVKPVSVAFPPCSDVLLSTIKTTGETTKDEITKYFDEYFTFGEHTIVYLKPGQGLSLDQCLVACTGKWQSIGLQQWPPPWCLPPSCVTLAGNRHLSPSTATSPPRIKRLFIADLVWLFYFERFGVFKILGVILDDFATKGKIPISNGVVNPEAIEDDLIALVLEAMVRQTEMGESSTVRRRDSSYRRCLGWASDVGRKLGVETVVNTAFHNLFHKFIQSALEYYKDKRLATAIQATTTPGKPSVATLITIGDTINVLKKSFDSFDYGRNYSNTLSGIVWVIAGMALIREIRTTLGIPPAYNEPYEYLPAAYDLLVMGRPITPAETNRYTIHRECANDARDLLLDIEVLADQDPSFASPGGELELWLNLAENKIEGYRTAYRSLTGVDLGAPGTPVIEQQV